VRRRRPSQGQRGPKQPPNSPKKGTVGVYFSSTILLEGKEGQRVLPEGSKTLRGGVGGGGCGGGGGGRGGGGGGGGGEDGWGGREGKEVEGKKWETQKTEKWEEAER